MRMWDGRWLARVACTVACTLAERAEAEDEAWACECEMRQAGRVAMKRLGAGGRVCWGSNATSRCTPGEGRLSRLRLRSVSKGLRTTYASMRNWTGVVDRSPGEPPRQVTKPSQVTRRARSQPRQPVAQRT